MFTYPYRNIYHLYRVRSNERESQEKSVCPSDFCWWYLRVQSRPVQSRRNSGNHATYSELFVIRNYVCVLDQQQSEADQDPENIRV